MSRLLGYTLSLGLLALAVAPFALAQNPDDLASPGFTITGSFCPAGVVEQIRWQLAGENHDAGVWGSFCERDTNTGRIESTKFLAPATLSLFVSGYLGTPGLRLALRNSETGEEIELRPPTLPAEHWQAINNAVPANWVGRPVQLIGEDQSTATHGWFGFTTPLLPYSSIAIDMISSNRPESGFCPDGVDGGTQWPTVSPPPSVVAWGSYCESGDNDTGWMASRPVVAGSSLTFYLAGYPGTPGIRLTIEDLETARQLPVEITNIPGELWRLYHIPLPAQWKGQQVRLLAEDTATGPAGWIAFTEPRSTAESRAGFVFAYRVLGSVLLSLVVLILPAAAVAVLMATLGVSDVVDLTTGALLTLGLVGYAAFWVYFLNHAAGLAYTYLVVLCSCLVMAYAWMTRARHRVRLAPLRRMLHPLLLMTLACVFVISVGFIYGKPQSVQDYAANRFAPPSLWIDNLLPKLLADGVYRGHIPKPLINDWLSSDRPPLQSGIVLWMYPLTINGRDLPYEIAAVILQLTFLVGLWAYLEACQVNRKAVALVLAATFFSGFTLLNSFFTWPKLFAVGFLLLIPAYLFTGRYARIRNQWRVGAALGVAAALAMLSHGGSAFALVGIIVTFLLLRRVPGPRFLLAGVIAAALLYLPWTLYQKYYDPPGDRLVKWHIGGSVEPRSEDKLLDLLITNYGHMHPREILNYKLRNISQLYADSFDMWKRPAVILQTFFTGNEAQRAASVAWLRYSMFVHWFPSIDLFLFAPLALFASVLLRRRGSPEFQQAWRLWLCTAITLAIWCLLMFGPATTLVHQGCYFTEIAAFAGGVLALWSLSPRLAAAVTACHIVFSLAIYVWLTPPQPVGVETLMGPLNPLLTCAAILAGGGLLFILWYMARAAWPPAAEAFVHESGCHPERSEVPLRPNAVEGPL